MNWEEYSYCYDCCVYVKSTKPDPTCPKCKSHAHLINATKEEFDNAESTQRWIDSE